MTNNIDHRLEIISDFLYRKKNHIAKNISVKARKRAYQFELVVSNMDYTTVTVNSSKCYIITMPRSTMLPEDENLFYIKDMPYSEKMAFVECWNKELKAKLVRNMARTGNLGLEFSTVQ